MKIDLNGKRALVCGSTAGIGKASAFALARAGAEVTLLARNRGKLEAVCAELPRESGQHHDWIAADFSEPASVGAAVSGSLAAGYAWQILVNNTGGPPGGRAIDASPDEYLDAIRAHLINNQTLVQLLLPGFRAAKYGRVINIISTSVKAPIPGLGVSNTIRGAVASWAKTIATELAPDGVTVNNILPGFTDTARLESLFHSKAKRLGQSVQAIQDSAISTIPAGRLGKPEEIAAGVVFLASSEAAYINGINLPIDGGRLPVL
ncbi:MAG TPA: SDR family oxidoreductase [Phycisphaerales bacterium]|nr:SDR family oxidoreductase [Phycisphaerales bacterium]